MADIHANEREFQGQVITWLNGWISAGGTPFDKATIETSLTGDVRGFPDVVLWLNRGAQHAFCLMELKTPDTSAHDLILLEKAREKAGAFNPRINYFITWNMQELVIWEIKNDGRAHRPLPKRYATLDAIQTADDWTVDYKMRLLEGHCKELLDDLSLLQRYGHVTRIPLDATFFVNRLHTAAKTLHEYFGRGFEEQLAKNKKLRNEIDKWGKEQGIPDPLSHPDAISRQIVYRLLCKIIFYEAVRSKYTQLEPLALEQIDGADAQRALSECFARAKNIDWFAVFDEGLLDKIAWPPNAAAVIEDLLEDLENYSFRAVPQDVIGKVFEQLIPPEERHGLGQYFTPENLVDFILAFCVSTPDDAVFDPTCGTGTFLIRAYDRLDYLGNRDHRKRLKQLWGNDIAHFPAALATINLFGQDLSDVANFPRIIPPEDFFDIKPGDVFPFPLPTGPTEAIKTIDEKLPSFDAFVGNFPYIRQELTGNKDKIAEILKMDWPGRPPKLSGQADVYAAMFFHAATFAKPGARLGFVTSNAWLDTAYGYELQKLFLDKFKILAVVESRCEPWFEEAAVNTVFTVLQRCEDAAERDDHLAKFVKVRRRLDEIFPQDPKIKQRERWQAFEGRERAVENAGNEYYKVEGGKTVCTLKGLKSYQNGDFRIRVKTQRELRAEVEAAGRTVKWGQYLRAPDVYFEIKEALGDKLRPFSEFADIDFGIKTGINDFFYLTAEEATEKGIEPEYLTPVFKSPRESDTILIKPKDLKTLLFVCRETKEGLRKKRHYGALKYIEENETKRSGNFVYPEVPSVRGNNPGWWAVKGLPKARIFSVYAYGPRHVAFYSKYEMNCDHNLYHVRPKKRFKEEVFAALLNSAWLALSRELLGHINLGEGALRIHVEDISAYLYLPDIFKANLKQLDSILNTFNAITTRHIDNIPYEFNKNDRRAFDTAVLEALGLDPKKYLEPLYAGVTELVEERLGLGAQRKKMKKARVRSGVARARQDVEKEVLPQGFKPFPDAYVTYGRADAFKTQTLSKGPARLGAPFMEGRDVLDREGRLITRALSEEEARFIAYSCRPDVYAVKIPADAIKVHNAVVAYEEYLNGVYEDVFKALRARLQSGPSAERLTAEIFADHGVPLLFSRD